MAHGDGLRRNRCGVWCWRWVIPIDLRQTLGAREISRSLGTASRREAVAASLPLRLFAFRVVAQVRSGVVLSNEDMLRTLNAVKVKLIAQTEREEQEADADDHALRELKEARAVQGLVDQHAADLAEQRTRARAVVVQAHDAGKRQGIESGQARLSEAQAQHTAQLVQVVTGATKEAAAASAAGAAAVIEASKTKPGPLLSVVVDDYLGEGSTRGAGNEKTRLKLETALTQVCHLALQPLIKSTS